MKFIRVTLPDLSPLEKFVQSAGNSLETFRYFAKRPFSVISNHHCTWMLEAENAPVAYGHLDREDGVTWLGIAVTEQARGKGYGRKMMQRLMDSAAALGLRQVRLSVDNSNEPAIALYRDFGFELKEKRETFSFYEWNSQPECSAVMSSLAFMGESAEEMIDRCVSEKFALEFSSGMPFRADMENVFLEAPLRRFAHNYFPAPQEPFVLNLASGNETIRRKSIDHCVNGIRLSYAAGAPFFSAHAGFCIDPQPSELGQQLSRVRSFDRPKHWEIFLASVKEVLSATADLPTGFLLENNVLAKMNVYEDGANPLLCVEAEEMLRFVETIADPRAGILLDTAHLKVSANTLGFDLVKAAQQVLPVTRCVHHSDNEGLYDNNQPFGEDYWFRPLMKEAAFVVHVLEVRKQSAEALKQMEKLLFS